MVETALRGPLAAGPLLETLSLLSENQQSGLLTLRSINEEVSIHFEHGSVRAVSTNDERLRIGQMLIKQGHVTEEQIEQALALQSIIQSPERIGEVLIDFGYLSETEISQAIAQQIQYALVNLLRDRDGFYEFVPSDPEQSATLTNLISFEPIVLNATYLADRWLAEHEPERINTVPDTLINPGILERLDPRDRQLLETLLNTYDALHDLAWHYGEAAQQVKESIERLLQHLLLRSSSDTELPSSAEMGDEQPTEVERYVSLIEQPVDLWVLTSLSRNARHLLLALLNGEGRLSRLEEQLRIYTENPERELQELVSAGLITISPGVGTSPDSGNGNQLAPR